MMNADNDPTWDVFYEGEVYKVISMPERTDRHFAFCYTEVEAGEEYIDEWYAVAIDNNGEKYNVFWEFYQIKDNEDVEGEDWDTPQRVESI